MTDASLPAAVEIVEVSPRDGLQNEPVVVTTADKIALINRAIDFGARRIEVTSFVNPVRVPQMADAADLVAGLKNRDDVTYIGLVLNERGAERALATKVDQLGAVCIASDGLAIANQNQSSAESLTVAMAIVAQAKAAGRTGQITIGAAFGCPFDGEVSPDWVVDMAVRAAEANPVEIALADTIGVGVPRDIASLVARVVAAVTPVPVRVHFHNTRNTGVANVWAAVLAGATVVDSSLGGLGGCPFAPGAAGNVPTEDVVYMLERSGIATGVDLERLIDATGWLSAIMGKQLPGMLGRAGQFPAAARKR